MRGEQDLSEMVTVGLEAGRPGSRTAFEAADSLGHAVTQGYSSDWRSVRAHAF